MPHAEIVSSPQSEATLSDKLCRSALFNVLTHLSYGHLEIMEGGHTVAQFGNPASSLKAKVNVNSAKAYRPLLLGGSIGAGESYMEGLWETPDLTSVIRIFARNLSALDKWEAKFRWLTLPVLKWQHFRRRNTHEQAKRNIEAHYDLGNRLYSHFLDRSMMYSSAIYPDTTTSLSEAQQHKLRVICDKLQLTSDDHLLEIGTGWGGLAVFAARHYGCQVTTTTISEEQYSYALDWVNKENLQDRITLLKQDYRQLSGQYSKLVSIEMIEAVGKDYLGNFVEKCASLLANNGLMLLQSITIDDRRYDNYASSVDFIQKYIFPGGFLPSLHVLAEHVKRFSDMTIRDIQDIGLDYARTLNDWYQAFARSQDVLAEQGYDERFQRMWVYYLKYCEGGFLERTISTVQMLLTKPHYRDVLNRTG
ncbi:class I SAM-dependent methyltransferase [Alteromonas aestuariivivens]|uniref:Class I SAM-dependent methyltransferase n=1 Tax=Alteromonas aestuariivivens TaxID=1938339 RepID=A0A3D8MFJ7_9ALTE|nr:cyclopropane-fatty-acyl-phospholipid synthase family protein [Alteromonas aestuariivivens]RDV29390.1 class I SAM-dependent methyltransferase [Alteromonas aestuariivivens]